MKHVRNLATINLVSQFANLAFKTKCHLIHRLVVLDLTDKVWELAEKVRELQQSVFKC